jgi:ketosteroid isomerase-like protein
MKTRIISALALIAASVCFTSPVAADDAAGRVPTVTRLVKIFSMLENDWSDAVRQRNTAVVEKMVAPDFEMRTAAAPGVPIPRADWMRQSMIDPSFASHTEQMAAHDYGNVVVVSFLWNVDATAGGDAAASVAARFFVVDTWMQDGGNWRIGARYVAPATSDARVPGLPRDISEIPKKY